MVLEKTYQNIMEQIPIVSEPGSVYFYLSKTNIDKTFIGLIDKLTTVNDSTIAQWLNITPRTLRNYRVKDATLKDNIKEHIISILSLFKHGISTFGGVNLFEKWLSSPNFFLDEKAPSEFLDTISGIRFIYNRLTAMEYGENV
ncbi:MAG TPA: antitoxin Xre/MbcA/ParS toxin-binding domain-containing protein [Edaphocola sp.]|nr:antitoxin Xre/MbcA/ParS toxin-binding domain-containing protein [Edaphocola sp.]